MTLDVKYDKLSWFKVFKNDINNLKSNKAIEVSKQNSHKYVLVDVKHAMFTYKLDDTQTLVLKTGAKHLK